VIYVSGFIVRLMPYMNLEIFFCIHVRVFIHLRNIRSYAYERGLTKRNTIFYSKSLLYPIRVFG